MLQQYPHYSCLAGPLRTAASEIGRGDAEKNPSSSSSSSSVPPPRAGAAVEVLRRLSPFGSDRHVDSCEEEADEGF